MAQQPKLKRLAKRKYQCDDIAALHTWLESKGYQFYGRHALDEYGRFSHQETQTQSGHKTYSNGYIQVMTTGEIYTPDPYAWQLLDALLDDDLRERTV